MAKVVPVGISRALTNALVKGTAMSCLADFEVADFEAADPETGAGRAATDLEFARWKRDFEAKLPEGLKQDREQR